MEVVKGEWLPSAGPVNGSKLRHRKLMGRQRSSSTERGVSETDSENIDPLDPSSFRVFRRISQFHSNKAFGCSELTIPLRGSNHQCGNSNDVEEDGGSLWHFEHSTRPPLPLLMLNDVIGKENINFFCLMDGSVHGVKMPPELCGACCVGSSHGWLLMSHAVPTKSNSFFKNILMLPNKVQIKNFLFNPFNKDVIHLPSQTTLPFYGSGSQIYIRKAILSCAPTSDNIAAGKCVVVIICLAGNLAFCKPGDTSWSILDSADKGFWFVDIVFYEEKLYAISNDEDLSIFNGLGSEVTRINMVSPTNREPAFPIFFVDGQRVPLGDCQTIYLVQSDGDLIMVLRIWNYEPEYDEQIVCPIRTVQFKVFKLDCSIPQWVEIKSLGDKMLFLGTSCSNSYSAAKVGFTGNSIYFTDDNFDAYLQDGDRPSELRDLGLFQLDKGSIEPYFLSRFNSFSSRFIWVELSCVD